MSINKEKYTAIVGELKVKAILVAVSKTKPVEDILELYELGQRDFGENYVQELVDKAAQLPKDIRWHFIGHLQTNKVKFLAPFIYMIQSVDSLKLLLEIDKHAGKNQRALRFALSASSSRLDRWHRGRSASCPWECCSSLDSPAGGTPQLPPSPKESVAQASGLLHATTAREAYASRNRPRGRMEKVQKTGSPLGESFGMPPEAERRGARVPGVIQGSSYCLKLSYFH